MVIYGQSRHFKEIVFSFISVWTNKRTDRHLIEMDFGFFFFGWLFVSLSKANEHVVCGFSNINQPTESCQWGCFFFFFSTSYNEMSIYLYLFLRVSSLVIRPHKKKIVQFHHCIIFFFISRFPSFSIPLLLFVVVFVCDFYRLRRVEEIKERRKIKELAMIALSKIDK